MNTASEKWPDIIPLDGTIPPPFPIDALPKIIGDYVHALSEFTQTPSEMAGVLSLGVLAAAYQHRYEVLVREGYTEPLCMYLTAIANPGERKSPVHKHLTNPLHEYEKNRRESERSAVLANESQYRALEKRLSTLEKKFAEDHATEDDLKKAAQELAEFKRMYPYRLILDDVTPEKLTDVMSAQKTKALLISSAEGGIFDVMAGRYGDSANLDIFLKAWGRETISVDRVGRPANHIDNPALSFILTVQPSVLAGVMNNPSMRGRGLCGRFLYAVCNSRIGTRDSNPPIIPNDVKERYYSFIKKAMEDERRGVIKLGKEAHKVYTLFGQVIEHSSADIYDDMPDWINKFTGSVVRIAGLLHAAENEDPCSIPITAATMSRAIEIGKCLLTHAQVVYGSMREDSDEQEAKYLLKWIFKMALENERLKDSDLSASVKPLTKRNLFQKVDKHFRNMEELDRVLEILSDKNYIRIKEVSTAGKPSARIIINPVFTQGDGGVQWVQG